MWILVSKWSGRNMAMNFVALVIVIALVFIAYGKPPGKKVCCLREKTFHSSSWWGSTIAFNTEITQVVEVEPGNVVYINGHVIISNSKKEQHLSMPTTFTFFHSEWYTYSHETVQTIWQGWRKWGLLSTRDTVMHKLLEKCQQNICHEDHFTLDSYIQRLSFPAGYSGFTYFTHLHNKQ